MSVRLVSIICLGLLALSCSILGGDDEPPTYLFTAQAMPAAGGSVSPDSMNYEEGDSVLVEASAAEGYIFENWSGAISSNENPFEFEIAEDTDITANFRQVSSRYEAEMTVADESDSMVLKFGQDTSSSDNFDEGNDKESPPPPPDGSLHSYFYASDKELLYDFRGDKSLNVTWDMRYQIGSGNTLHLSWDIDITSLEGNLTLTNEDGSLSVDMNSESSVNIPSSDSGSLTIEYEVEN